MLNQRFGAIYKSRVPRIPPIREFEIPEIFRIFNFPSLGSKDKPFSIERNFIEKFITDFDFQWKIFYEND